MSCWIYCALVFIFLCKNQWGYLKEFKMSKMSEKCCRKSTVSSIFCVGFQRNFPLGMILPFLLPSTFFHLPNIKAGLKVVFFWAFQVKMTKGLNHRVWSPHSAVSLDIKSRCYLYLQALLPCILWPLQWQSYYHLALTEMFYLNFQAATPDSQYVQ